MISVAEVVDALAVINRATLIEGWHPEHYHSDLDRYAHASRLILQFYDDAISLTPIKFPALCRQIECNKDMLECLALSPRIFLEVFLGYRFTNGSFDRLDEADRIHFAPQGILTPPDRLGLYLCYQGILANASDPVVVEVGSAAGRGSTRIALDFMKHTSGRLYCVDPWQDIRWFTVFWGSVTSFGGQERITPMRMTSAEAVDRFADQSLDAVFIDGDHHYSPVRADIAAWQVKIKPGGLIFGHDCLGYPSEYDRDELLRYTDHNQADVSRRLPGGGIQQVRVHPGVILAVQDHFGDDVQIFSESVVWWKTVQHLTCAGKNPDTSAATEGSNAM